MNPAVKYTLGRIGLFIAALLVLLPFTQISFLLKLVIALIVSSALSWFVLRGWREQYSLQLQNAVGKRKADKDKLRSALSGDDEADHPTDTKDAKDASADPHRTDSDQH